MYRRVTSLADVLELDTPEKEALAVAYTFERSTTSGAIRQCAEEGGQ